MSQFEKFEIIWKYIRLIRKLFSPSIRNSIRFEGKIIRFVRFEKIFIRLIRKAIFYSKNSRKINSKFVRFDSTPPLTTNTSKISPSSKEMQFILSFLNYLHYYKIYFFPVSIFWNFPLASRFFNHAFLSARGKPERFYILLKLSFFLPFNILVSFIPHFVSFNQLCLSFLPPYLSFFYF